MKKARRAMGDPSPRRTAESKQKAVELYRKSGTTYAEVARGLGCDAGSLAGWVKKADAAALDLFERIEVVYNRTRIHSALGCLSPAEFEKANWPAEDSRSKAA